MHWFIISWLPAGYWVMLERQGLRDSETPFYPTESMAVSEAKRIAKQSFRQLGKDIKVMKIVDSAKSIENFMPQEVVIKED